MNRTIGDGSIEPDRLKWFVVQIEKHKDDAAGANAEANEMVKAAKDQGVHTDALKLCIKLRKWEPTKVKAFLDAFESYCHILGIDAQGELFNCTLEIVGDRA